MDFVKQWTLTVSTTLIISIIFSLLTPKGNMGRFYKIILSVFIFISFVYPLTENNFSISLPEFDDTIIVDEQQKSYENIVENTIKNKLNSAGYKNSSVSAEISYEDNLITVNSLKVLIQDNYDINEVKSYIKKETGYNPEVYYLGE